MALPLALDLALGHLGRRKRQSVVSVAGVATGVAFFIAIAAMMLGFQTHFINQVIDVAPHIVVKDEYRTPALQPAEHAFPGGAVTIRRVKPRDELRGIKGARAKIAALEALPGVAVAPTLRGQAILRYGARDLAAAIVGIDPDREKRVTNIEKDLVAGRLGDLRTTANGLILGSGLADRLGATVGDTLSLVTPAGTVLAMKVTGIVATGIAAIDNAESYALLKTVQIALQRPNVINSIRIRLADVTEAERMARRIEARYGYRTESWEETNVNVLNIFVIQRAVMFSVTGAILIVAAFGIFNIISTVVHEKTRDIAILKSLGLTEGDIVRVFVIEGMLVGLVGAALGCLIGYGMVTLLGQVRFKMDVIVRGEQGFFLAREPWHYLFASGFAVAASTLAALLPARKAARLNPVDIVRGAA